MLAGALARANTGVGSVVLIGGEAGIGKSRLISELAGRADRDGVVVLVGECLPLGDAELPFAPLLAALRGLEDEHEPVAVQPQSVEKSDSERASCR